MKTLPSSLRWTPLAALALLAALAGCQPRDDTTLGQQLDRSVERAAAEASEARDAARQGLDPATDATRRAGQEAAAAGQRAVADATNAVNDAAITADVNAELARDPQLAAAAIDVDTVNGQVALKGVAPNPDARERATRIAAAVPGVVSVENRLAVAHAS